MWQKQQKLYCNKVYFAGIISSRISDQNLQKRNYVFEERNPSFVENKEEICITDED